MLPVAIPLSREQRLWLAGVMTLAAGLRFAGIDQLSLSHMDEGGYFASAMMVAAEGPYSFPFSQALQSPPLLPWLIGALVWLTQAQWPILGLLTSAAFGTGSVWLLFLLGRRWGGNCFGLWAATLLAVSDFHVAYSRMVLTDVPLTFWFLLTIYCVTRTWERTDSPFAGENLGTKISKGTGKRRVVAAPVVAPRRIWIVTSLWGLAAGLAAGAAWNTKYNGWLVVAIGLFSTAMWMTLQRLFSPRSIGDTHSLLRRDGVLVALQLLIGVVAAVCFAHWYLYVERHFEGGYAAVTKNHRGYFYSPIEWPSHAHRLIASLAALRHYGWILTLGIALGLVWRVVKRVSADISSSRRFTGRLLSIHFALGLALIVLVQGGDAALFILGAVGIVPALYAGNWQRLLAAVWCGTFVVLTPLYHPYARLMLPALPAAICLVLWLLQDVWPGLLGEGSSPPDDSRLVFSRRIKPRNLAVGALVAAAGVSLIWLLGSHPFGLFLPTRGVWNRWTSRQSYRVAGEAILEHTDADALVICQAQLAMVAYCRRTPLPVEEQSFETWLREFPQGKDCFLAVDYCWIHGKTQRGALQGLQQHARDLTPMAVIANDLNIISLLDQLRPDQVAAKLAWPQPEYQMGAPGQRLPAPPPLAAPFEDVIVLYRVKLPHSR